MPHTADLLARLHRLLALPAEEVAPTALSLPLLQAWKPRAEQLALAHQTEAFEVAGLLAELAAQSDDRAALALACWICGNIYHNLGAMSQAHDAYRQADDLYAAPPGDPLSAARMSVGWVHVLGDMGEGDQALACAQRAEAILQASGDPADARRRANLYGNRGIVHEQMGHLVAALADYQRKLAFFQQLPDHTPEALLDEAMALNDIGVTQALLGQYNDAEASLQTALERLASDADAPFLQAGRTLVLMDVAWLKVLRHSPPGTVRRAFQQARASRDQLVDASAHLYLTCIDLDEANYLVRSSQWQEVDCTKLNLLRTRLIDQRIEFEAAYASLLLGQLDYHAGHYDQALATFAQVAVECLEKTLALAYLAYLWQARTHRALGDGARAEDALTVAVHLIEQTRRRLTVDDYRAGYLEDKLVAYQELIELHLVRGAFDKALAVSEHSKARTLTEAIANPTPKSGSIGKPSFFGSDPVGSAFIGNSVSRSHTTLGADASLDAALGGVAGWPAQPFPVANVAAHLPADALAISYVEVHDRLWAFLLDAAGLVAPPVELGQRLTRADLENGLRKLQRIAHEPALTPELVAQQIMLAQAALQSWRAAFLTPLQPWLDRYAQVVIAPDGLMNALPFACLYDEANRRYFCETHAITLTPSLALWPALSTVRNATAGAPGGQMLVVGVSSKGGVMGALPAAVAEANAVAGLFAAPTLLTEHAATVAQFTQAAPQAPLIYLAAHGEFHLADPAASFIELADGPLRVRDILALRLAAPVVVLNACDTSRGYLIGNELMGLVRGFFYAGAAVVVAAQWQVEDVAASDLMTQIMHQAQAGHSLAFALQRAQQRFIHRSGDPTAHPFFWGAFAVTGAGNRRLDV